MRHVKQLALVGAASAAVVAMVAMAVAMKSPRVVSAACGTQWPDCPGGDGTRTSSLTVSHIRPAGVGVAEAPVEPDDTDTWSITGVWSTTALGNFAQCRCKDISNSVTAAVTWNGVSQEWDVSCTGCDAANGPIRAVSVCNAGGCAGGGQAHSSQYELIVDLDVTQIWLCPPRYTNYTAYLQRVEYAASSLDGGNVLDMSQCTEGVAVQPVGTSAEATDFGSFECDFDCSTTGPTVQIEYQ